MSSPSSTDLQLVTRIARDIQAFGGRALIVGGYIRDTIIARRQHQPVGSKDIDVEVYGMPFDELVELLSTYGRIDLVGASFGIVKLTHPDTRNVIDFSIPRRDSKADRGHRGFVVTGDPSMSIQEAAQRRDFTMNAMAQDPLTEELFDFYGGQADLAAGVLRATSPELFGDDTLRVLRAAQFASRFSLTIDPATADICRSLDLTDLPKERLLEEWLKLMLKSPRPSVGLEMLRQLGVLRQLHPELEVLDQIEQEPDWHPEGNVWEHTKHAVDAAAWVVREEHLDGDDALVVLFGALCHDLGKATTTERRLKDGHWRITAHGHEAAGVAPTQAFLDSIGMKSAVTAKILPIVRTHLRHISNPNPTDAHLRRFAVALQPANIWLWSLVSRCDSNGRGEAFRTMTPSYHYYERSRQLQVHHRPLTPLVQGRDLMARGQQPGPHFTPVLEFLYEAQLTGAFTTGTDGLAYLAEHQAEVDERVAQHLAAHATSRRKK